MSWFWLQRDGMFSSEQYQRNIVLLHRAQVDCHFKVSFSVLSWACFCFCLCYVFSLALSRQQFQNTTKISTSNISGFLYCSSSTLYSYTMPLIVFQRENIKRFAARKKFLYLLPHTLTHTKHQPERLSKITSSTNL